MQKVVPTDAQLIPNNAQRVFTGEIFDVYQWEQPLFDGSPATFEMLKRPDTVNAICIVDDQILLLDDEQPNTGVRVSLPGGRVDTTDDSTLTAAQREIHEETGYSFANWRLVRVLQPHNKLEWFVYTYVAWGVTGREEPHIDAGERITVRLTDLSTLQQLAATKTGRLDALHELIAPITSLEDLTMLPEYRGQTVTRTVDLHQ